MKKISVLLVAAVIGLASFKSEAPSTWNLDPFHSQLHFSLGFLGLSDINGTFQLKEGTLSVPNDDFADAAVSITADTKTVDTDNDERDKHLRTADFFDAEKYPSITFKSSSFKKVGDKYKVDGELTFHGVTKPVSLDVVGKQGVHPVTKKTIAGFKVTGVIRRSDFGISPNTPAAMLTDEVQIIADIQFVKS